MTGPVLCWSFNFFIECDRVAYELHMATSQKTNRFLNNIFYVSGIVLFVVFFVFTVWGKEGLVHLIALRKTRAEMILSNHELTKSNFLLLEEIEKLKQADYMEQKARSEMGMVRENEVVFIVR